MTTQVKGRERRLYPRRPFRTKVVFEDELGDGLFYVYSEDVSMGGLYLASDIPVKKGALLFLSFTLPGHKRSVRVTGEVVRRRDAGDAEKGGMGVRFLGLADMAKKRLQDFLEVDL